jgi:ABC transport system ATP-binding/permease protein
MLSESILRSLLQIFAIIARPESDYKRKRTNVRNFLNNQLNQVGVKKWLKEFDIYFKSAQDKRRLWESDRQAKRAGREITKRIETTPEKTQSKYLVSLEVVQKIDDISPDLPMEMKVTIIIQLLEFCKSENPIISDLQDDIITGVANIININFEEVRLIKEFVLNENKQVPDYKNILLIDREDTTSLVNAGHFRNESIDGQIWVMHIPSISSCYVRYHGKNDLTILSQPVQEENVYHFPKGSYIAHSGKSGINKIYYSDIIFHFKSKEFNTAGVLYEVRDIEYRFKSGQVGFSKMSFSDESGKLVGIMGASGSGKSTLLSVLNGTNTPYKGEVLINGINIHKEKERVKGLIGFVSQDDLLIEDLTVYENLYFNAKLCFDNLRDEEIIERVNNTLKRLGLLKDKDKKVGNPVNPVISGGQRKRLNISLELIREPAILFLDEPTSGLSSSDSENILALLDDLTKKGKLVFVVLHQPSSDIFKMFDRLVILDKDEQDGGYMIFNGNPLDSIEHFRGTLKSVNYTENECHACHNVNPEQIFSLIEARILDKNGLPTDERKIKAKQWHIEFFGKGIRDRFKPITKPEVPEINFKIPGWLKQIFIFTLRDFKTKVADTQYVMITLLEAPILAFFLAFLIRYFNENSLTPKYAFIDNTNLPVYIFMSVIVAVFMGMTLSAEEIIKNRKILKRESFLNLSWNSYLMSKVIVQFIISGIQAFLFVLIGNTILGIKGMILEYWIVLFSCWAFSNMLGLLISDSFKTVVTIYILIPFLVIPQILLSGIIVKYEKLNPSVSSPGIIPLYGEFITARWGYEALAVYQFVHNKYNEQFYPYDKELSKAKYMKDYWSVTLKGKLSEIHDDLSKGVNKSGFEDNLKLVKNELSRRNSEISNLKYDFIDSLTPENISLRIVESANEYIENVRKSFVKYYIDVTEKKDKLILKQESIDKDGFLKLKNNYFNSTLDEFVTNRNEKERIIEYQGKLIQKFDPIYIDPEYRIIKAHFYSPTKNLFGSSIDTFIVNILVIWIMTIFLYITLYMRILKKSLDFVEKIFNLKSHSS